jgi:hypothetical protein
MITLPISLAAVLALAAVAFGFLLGARVPAPSSVDDLMSRDG